MSPKCLNVPWFAFSKEDGGKFKKFRVTKNAPKRSALIDVKIAVGLRLTL